MDYEKVYKELIEKLRKAKDDIDVCDDRYCVVIDDLVPELQESEDERIRKEIVGFIDNVLKDKNVLLLVADRIGDNIPSMIPDWIAYLERQKEYIEDIRQYAYNKGLVDAEEKQKPVNLDEDVELGLDRALQIIKDAKGNLCGYQSDDGIYECDHAIQTLERILKNGIEQKAAEWSEKDEAMRDNILRVLSCFVGTAECESNPSLSTSYPLYRREIDWLKSLRLDLKKKNEDVAKLCSNEWSEEDENKLNHILEIVHIASGTEASVNEKEELESFLKSLRPQPKQEWNEEDEENFKWFDKFFRAESIVLGGRDIPQDKYLWFKSLRSRPKSSDTWKPSVEQMEALQYSIGNGGKYNKDALESLYNDLKKLM